MNKICLKTDKVISAYPLVCAVLDIAEVRGASREKILRGTGIFEEDISQQHLISPSQVLTLFANAESLTRGSDTAFQIGKSLASSHLSETQSALRACYSLTDVVRLCSTARWTFSPFISFHRYSTANETIFVLEDAIGCAKNWTFVIELYTSMWVALCKHWSGQRQPFSFTFPNARPRYIQEYETNLGYRLTFDAPLLSVRIAKNALSAPLPEYDPVYRAVLRHKLSAQTVPQSSLLDGVRAVVRRSPSISLEELAAKWQMSPATLKRRLRAHCASFRTLIDETRREHAIYLLAVQKLSNEKSALQMAFSDLTNFRRSVKRWTGLTPSELRQV